MRLFEKNSANNAPVAASKAQPRKARSIRELNENQAVEILMRVQSNVAVDLLVVVLADARAPRRRHPRSTRHPRTFPPVMMTTSSHDNLEKLQCGSQTLRSVKPCGTSTENTKVLRYPTND